MPVARRMTAVEFEKARRQLADRRNRMSARSIEAARMALVEGQVMQSVANRVGFNSRQQVYDAVCVFWNELLVHHSSVQRPAPGVLRHYINGQAPFNKKQEPATAWSEPTLSDRRSDQCLAIV